MDRLLPGVSSQIGLGMITPKDGRDRFRISNVRGGIMVQGSSESAMLFGVNWYLKYVAHLQISTNGNQLKLRERLPVPVETIELDTACAYRYALNENTDGYSSPYWDWPRWQHEIDVLALSGINATLVERGTDTVLYETFRDFGFSDLEIRRWITQPAHQNWQLLGNMCCFDGPISRPLLAKRLRSAQKIVARLRSLGITPVFPGFYGMVPEGMATKYPQAHIVPQGDWNGLKRPAWLDPRDPLFAKVAASFYRHQRALFGDSSIYDMNVFQEGGTAADVPIGEASQRIQTELLKAHPEASWMMLAWQNNPPAELLRGVNRDKLLIVDIEQGRKPRESRELDFMHAPFLFGGLWEFGGRSTMGANLYDYGVRLPSMRAKATNMSGIAVFPEGMDNNPFAFDLFTEMAWRAQPVSLPQWTAEYAERRYGERDPHALRAWQVLLNTAYGSRADGVETHGERDAAQESLFNAQPGLSVAKASTWAPDEMRYKSQEFSQALVELLQASPAVRKTETYRYDIVDVTRQVLANRSRELLPEIQDAYVSGNEPLFHCLTKEWLDLMEMQDELLSSNQSFLLGEWLRYVSAWASSDAESARLFYDARSILTTWGDRKAAEAGLHDYGNKDWAGLTGDYYLRRWKLYFESLERALQMHAEPEQIDWFAIGDKWNREHQQYSAQAQGDSYAIALRIAEHLGLTKAR
ncbi:alpha-N-acetylglucosaminidase [Acidicapsa ligni]|uniref:alpha-N-acetylglucosaminidase n=1 Tax=Acidicapsa ligni TaxID=542300 RepID=UPI0021DF4B9B|nr:alpha-N-acetylglucosaminidase [Acidicapsa ligni]